MIATGNYATAQAVCQSEPASFGVNRLNFGETCKRAATIVVCDREIFLRTDAFAGEQK
jgi:hypothetical protein